MFSNQFNQIRRSCAENTDAIILIREADLEIIKQRLKDAADRQKPKTIKIINVRSKVLTTK